VVENAGSLVDNAQLKAREHFVPLEHAEMGTCLYDSLPYHVDGRPAKPSRAAPLLGEHTAEVCRELLGMTDGEAAELAEEGVLT